MRVCGRIMVGCVCRWTGRVARAGRAAFCGGWNAHVLALLGRWGRGEPAVRPRCCGGGGGGGGSALCPEARLQPAHVGQQAAIGLQLGALGRRGGAHRRGHRAGDRAGRGEISWEGMKPV